MLFVALAAVMYATRNLNWGGRERGGAGRAPRRRRGERLADPRHVGGEASGERLVVERRPRRRPARMARPMRSVAPQRPSARRTHLTGWPTRTPASAIALCQAWASSKLAPPASARTDRASKACASRSDGCRRPRHGRAGRARPGGPAVFSTISARTAAWKARMTRSTVSAASALEALELEDRGFEPQQQAEIDAVRQRVRARPAAPAIRRGGRSSRSPRAAAARPRPERGRHQGEAAERRPAHELGAGDEDDRAARQIVAHRRAGDPRLAGVDDQGGAVAMRVDQPVDVGERGQDQPGLRAVDDMDEAVPARPRGRRRSRRASARRYRPRAAPGPSGRGPECRSARHGAAEARHRLARHGRRRRARSRRRNRGRARNGCSRVPTSSAPSRIAWVPPGRAPGDAGQGDIFEVGARRREDDRDVVRDPIGARGSARAAPRAARHRLRATAPAPISASTASARAKAAGEMSLAVEEA